MNEKKYIAAVLSLSVALTLSVAGANFAVNPLGIYRAPGAGDIYPAATYYARLKKTEDVKRLKPDAIVTGTSRADIGLDPRPEFFPGMVSYDFALSASTIREQRAALEFAEAVHPLKEAVITLDLFAFDAHRLENKAFEPQRFSPAALRPMTSFFNTYGTLVTIDTLIASIKHLRAMRHPERFSAILANGRNSAGDIAYDVSVHGADRLFDKPRNAEEIAADNFTFNYPDGGATFGHLDAMLAVARANGTKAFLVISPVHESYLKTLNPALAAEWKTRVTKIARAYGVPLWDFAYENAVTADKKWFWDSNHYKPALGDVVLRKVLKGSREMQGFGRQLN
jgi:hypothetical protein